MSNTSASLYVGFSVFFLMEVFLFFSLRPSHTREAFTYGSEAENGEGGENKEDGKGKKAGGGKRKRGRRGEEQKKKEVERAREKQGAEAERIR